LSTQITADISRIELEEIIRSHSLGLVLGKKLAIFLVVLTILVTLTFFLSAVILLVNLPLKLFDFEAMSPLKVVGVLMLLGFAIAIVPGLFTYFTLPRIYDRELKLKMRLPEGQGAPISNKDCNRKLAALGGELRLWQKQGLIDKHGDVFCSEQIQANVITYGNLDRARVVFALDVLQNMSLSQLRSILAHETGHVVQNDYIILCLFSEVTKILHYLYLPFQFLGVIVRIVFSLIERLPLGILRYLVSGLGFLVRFLIRLISMPLWLPRALLYWESQIAEYLADDFGVALSGSASGLITSLMKLEDMRVELGKSGFPRRYDLFATVVEHGRALETNTVLGDMIQFLSELETSHPQSIRRWGRLASLGFQDARIR